MADQIEAAAIRLQDQFLALLLSTGEDLSPEQREAFVEAFMAKQEEFEADRLERSDEAYRADLEERFDDQLSRYLGPMTAPQSGPHCNRGGGNDPIGSFLVGRQASLDSAAVRYFVGRRAQLAGSGTDTDCRAR